MAYDAAQDFEKAKSEYAIITQKPYENEEAMHNLAYIMYEHIENYDYKTVIDKFFDAINGSRIEKNPKNFNDLGRLLMDIYHQKIALTDKEENTRKDLKTKFENIKNPQAYPEAIQIEFNRITNTILDEQKKLPIAEIMLQTAERLFHIADILNRKDAFANKNIGDIYYEKYLQSTDNERNKHEYADKALKKYILANSYYLIDNKQCEGLESKISELEKYLKRNILRIKE